MSHASSYVGGTPTDAYKPFARVLHWLMALLILATIPVGQMMVMPGWPRATGDALYIFHKNVGVVLLLLLVVRLVYRLMNPPPPLPSSVPPVQQMAAGLTHLGLYVLIAVMAISGYVRVKAGGFPLESLDALGVPSLVPRSDDLGNAASRVHALARIGLILLILMHIGAAAFHGVVKRDGVFSRMWPARGR